MKPKDRRKVVWDTAFAAAFVSDYSKYNSTHDAKGVAVATANRVVAAWEQAYLEHEP